MLILSERNIDKKFKHSVAMHTERRRYCHAETDLSYQASGTMLIAHHVIRNTKAVTRETQSELYEGVVYTERQYVVPTLDVRSWSGRWVF